MVFVVGGWGVVSTVSTGGPYMVVVFKGDTGDIAGTVVVTTPSVEVEGEVERVGETGSVGLSGTSGGLVVV